MPKKTKKQKILADLRRKNIPVISQNPGIVKTQIQNPQIEYKPSYVTKDEKLEKIDTKPKGIHNTNDYSYVRHDLIRISLFTLFALAFQGMLYYLIYMR